MRIQRLIGLLYVLAEVDKITVQELADKFEVYMKKLLGSTKLSAIIVASLWNMFLKIPDVKEQ